jgi:hypothetical protein
MVTALIAVLLAALVAADTRALLADLSVIAKSQDAVEALVKQGAPAVPGLTGLAVEGSDLTQRGWAIVALTRINTPPAMKALEGLPADSKQPVLVRTWAAAGLIKNAKDLQALVALQKWTQSYPATRRTFSMRARQLAGQGKPDAEALLAMVSSNWQLQQDLADAVLGSGAPSLIKAMFTSKNQTVRQQAAGYLGTLAQRQGKAGNELVGLEVVKALKANPDAADVPWAGGPLYVPNIGWDKQMGSALVESLIGWYVWAELNARKEEHSKLEHNLNSLSLGQVVGYQAEWNPHDVHHWLKVWKQVAGQEGLLKLLKAQGALKDARFSPYAEGK